MLLGEAAPPIALPGGRGQDRHRVRTHRGESGLRIGRTHSLRDVLEQRHASVRRELERFRGQEITTTGDGFLATFDGPARAVRCAVAIRDRMHESGLEVRAGVHTGECERMGDNIGGLAVHIGSRVAGLASPGEVLASSTVKDLVSGSGIVFEDRGAHSLKGIPGEWHVFKVASV